MNDEIRFRSIVYPSAVSRGWRGPVENYALRPSPFEQFCDVVRPPMGVADAATRSVCPHGEPVEDCQDCYVDADRAFDAARESRFFR